MRTALLWLALGGAAAAISDPLASFTAGPQAVVIYSGTWEKFPSRTSWEKMEYINIGQGQYRGTLTLAPGERGKLHYHLQGAPAAVRLRASLAVAGRSTALEESVTRPADRAPVAAGAAGHDGAGNGAAYLEAASPH